MSFLSEVGGVLQDWAVGDGWHDVARLTTAAAVIYVVALWIVRTGKKRFLGRNTVFDFLLAFILGSVLSRAINGNAPIGPTALAGFVLVGMHWLFGLVAERGDSRSQILKGRADTLIADGELDHDEMRAHHITRRDIEEAARQAGLPDLEAVESAYFERNGAISIIPKRRVDLVDVRVEEGVQRVRIEIIHP